MLFPWLFIATVSPLLWALIRRFLTWKHDVAMPRRVVLYLALVTPSLAYGYGAVFEATDSTGDATIAYSRDISDKAQAVKEALKHCVANYKNCHFKFAFSNQCLAIAQTVKPNHKRPSYVVRDTPEEAFSDALGFCYRDYSTFCYAPAPTCDTVPALASPSRMAKLYHSSEGSDVRAPQSTLEAVETVEPPQEPAASSVSPPTSLASLLKPTREGRPPRFGFDFSTVPFSEYGKPNDLPENMHGAYIFQVYRDTPAYKSGLERGHILLAVNGYATPTNESGVAAIAAAWHSGASELVLDCWNTATGKVDTFRLPFPASETVATAAGPATAAVVSTAADPATHPTVLPAGELMFVAYNELCSKTDDRATMQPASELYYHQAINYEPHKPYLMCSSHGEWGSISPYCTQVWLAPYSLVCRGAVATPAELTLATASQNDTSLPPISIVAGSSPPIVEVPYKDEGQLKTQQLPAGWGMILQPQDKFTAPSAFFTRALAGEFPVMGTPPTGPNTVRNFLFDLSPFVQILFVAIVSFYAFLAYVGRYAYSASFLNPGKPVFLIALAAACIGIYGSAYNPKPYTDRIFAQATAAAERVTTDRATLPTLFTLHNGMVEPFSKETFLQAKAMLATHIIPDTAGLQSDALVPVYASLAPIALLLLVFIPWMQAGRYHLFVRLPIEKILKPALKTAGPINTKAVNAALDPYLAQSKRPPPAYQSENDASILSIYANEAEKRAAEFGAEADATETTLGRMRAYLFKLASVKRARESVSAYEIERRRNEALKQQLQELQRQLQETEKDT